MRHSTIADLRKLFDESIPATAIAEPLASFDEYCESEAISRFMDSNNFDLVGLNVGGLTTTYVNKLDLRNGETARQSALRISDGESLSERDSLLSAVRVVKAHGHAFVVSLGQAVGIITWADLSKPPVRMWLFNLVGLLEMRLLELIRQHHSEGTWESLLPEKQLNEARDRLVMKQLKNQETDLIDCLGFADVSRVVRGTPALDALLGTAEPDTRQFLYDARQLRNALAHSQEILARDWPVTIGLAERIEASLTALDGHNE